MLHTISVSIVYAKADKQWLVETKVSRGTSALELFEQSGLRDQCGELAVLKAQDLMLGVFSQKVDTDHLLEHGDRLEVYRPLTADPKEVRRQLALVGKTMGNK